MMVIVGHVVELTGAGGMELFASNVAGRDDGTGDPGGGPAWLGGQEKV